MYNFWWFFIVNFAHEKRLMRRSTFENPTYVDDISVPTCLLNSVINQSFSGSTKRVIFMFIDKFFFAGVCLRF